MLALKQIRAVTISNIEMVHVCIVYSTDLAYLIFGQASMIQINQLSNASWFQQIKLLFITTYNGTPFAGLQEYATILTWLY